MYKGSTKLLKDYLTVDQIIMYEICTPGSEPKTIEHLQQKLGMPRSTVVDHLDMLVKDGLVVVKKDDERNKNFYVIREDAGEKIKTAIEKLNQAYVYALGIVRQKQLKELKELEKEGGG